MSKTCDRCGKEFTDRDRTTICLECEVALAEEVIKNLEAENAALREKLEAENMVLAKLGAVQGRYYPFVGEADYNNGYNAAIRVVDGIINEWRGGQEGKNNEKI
ncbi:hypothetical protein [Christensenella minuta]|uniref:hypothetical protein n=1 Tax=Christensenella minuta TaxID=626937 RepID=UPI002157E4B1|nr:hypothetical protein [Christensenella minuta]